MEVMKRRRIATRVFPPGYGHSGLPADLRPWEANSAFLAAWRLVRENTMVDQARLYELWDLIGQIHGKIPGIVLEVGAWRGGSAALMALRLKALDDPRPVIVADTFQGVAKAGCADPYYTGGEHSDTSLDFVTGFLDYLALPQCAVLRGVFPDDTAHRVPAADIAFCHIDVDVYESARDVFEWVWPRMPTGGIVVFDDYGFFGCEGITSYVHTLRSAPDMMIVSNLNGHAVAVKTR